MTEKWAGIYLLGGIGLSSVGSLVSVIGGIPSLMPISLIAGFGLYCLGIGLWVGFRLGVKNGNEEGKWKW